MTETRNGTALVLGVGPGLGAALVRRFRAAGYAVAAASRQRDKVAGIFGDDSGVRAYQCDATDGAAVAALVEAVERELGPLAVAIANSAGWRVDPFLDLSAADFTEIWRQGCLGAFHLGQEAARRMVPRGRGTILFTGSAAQMRAGVGFAALAVAKSGLRALSQAMGRELAPKGIHVAHMVLDGPIDSERTRVRVADAARLLDPAGLAEAYYFVHCQKPAAWTNEMDLRTAADWP
ncbi:MAG: short-chain dehydrogenase [Rhodospirillales bacterium]|jgi:NAD(P)-dependent dehydrogenase (short-subunit alcohol dehydrogenase family)|nr:short-chain dehydrogenase [Rhodospirillales bacterium]